MLERASHALVHQLSEGPRPMTTDAVNDKNPNEEAFID
jgi:hypothetical protein